MLPPDDNDNDDEEWREGRGAPSMAVVGRDRALKGGRGAMTGRTTGMGMGTGTGTGAAAVIVVVIGLV